MPSQERRFLLGSVRPSVKLAQLSRFSRCRRDSVAPPRGPLGPSRSRAAMAPHLSRKELDRCFFLYAAGKTPVEICDLISRTRESLDETRPDLTTVRRALRGATHARGRAETRGRKPKLTAGKLRAMENARVRLIRAAKGEREVHLKDVLKAARISDVHTGTASKHFKRLGVSWRAPRAEPLRGSADAEERVAVCSKWKRLPNNYFTHQVDAIIDNKVFAVPVTQRAKTHARKSRVRGHLRTKAEGARPSAPMPFRAGRRNLLGGSHPDLSPNSWPPRSKHRSAGPVLAISIDRQLFWFCVCACVRAVVVAVRARARAGRAPRAFARWPALPRSLSPSRSRRGTRTG